jgi:hypothetical protein
VPRTPQDFGGPLYEDEIRFYDQYGVLPFDRGGLLYSDGYFYAYDEYGIFNLKDGLVQISGNDDSAGYLIEKVRSGDSSVIVSEENDGYNEYISIVANVDNIFSVDTLTSIVLAQTTSTTPQDALAGSSLTVGEAGDYLAFFEADLRVTNNNGIMAIGIGLNGINSQAGSERQFEGNDRGSNITIYKLSGLTAGDTVHGVFYKISGPGTGEIRNRSLTIMRIT